MKSDIKNLIFVDCEVYGKSPSTGMLTEFGVVAYPSRDTFHGVLAERKPAEDSDSPKRIANEKNIFEKFEQWLLKITNNELPVYPCI